MNAWLFASDFIFPIRPVILPWSGTSASTAALASARMPSISAFSVRNRFSATVICFSALDISWNSLVLTSSAPAFPNFITSSDRPSAFWASDSIDDFTALDQSSNSLTATMTSLRAPETEFSARLIRSFGPRLRSVSSSCFLSS